MQNIINPNDAALLDALSPTVKALIFKSTKALKNLTAACVLTSKEDGSLTNETANYWQQIITDCETLEMFFMQDDSVKSLV
jgi:tellurite resistance protein